MVYSCLKKSLHDSAQRVKMDNEIEIKALVSDPSDVGDDLKRLLPEAKELFLEGYRKETGYIRYNKPPAARIAFRSPAVHGVSRSNELYMATGKIPFKHESKIDYFLALRDENITVEFPTEMC